MVNFYFIHGFLGQPKDWDPLISELQRDRASGDRYHTYDIWQQGVPTFQQWGQNFAKSLVPENKNVLVGYSMGGRLLLNAADVIYKNIHAMILISVRLRLPEGVSMLERRNQDRLWAQRFRKENWDSTVDAWNRQPIFKQDQNRPQRQEADFSRLALAYSLEEWSLSRQNLNWEEIKKWKFPVLMITGEQDDLLQAAHAKDKMELPQWQWQSVPGGHSPQFSHPSQLAVVIDKFLR